MSRKFKLSVLAAAVLAAPLAQAYEQGDFILRAGPVHVAPDDSSSTPVFTGAGPLAGETLTLSGTGVGVEGNTQLGITATYMLAPNIGLGVLGATPFNHDIKGEGGLAQFGKLAETKHLPPTLTLQYFPMASSSRVQPYFGAGINYTNFFEEKTTDTFTTVIDVVANANYGTPLGTVTGSKLELDDSIGLALEVGVDYMLTDNLGINAAVWWADIDTEATVTAYAGDTNVGKITTDVEIDPMVYMVSVAYKF